MYANHLKVILSGGLCFKMRQSNLLHIQQARETVIKDAMVHVSEHYVSACSAYK